MIFSDRPTAVSRDVRAGCFLCHGNMAHWWGGNAQGVAARHHDATGHATWCDVAMSIRYGTEAPDPRQVDIEETIAASSGGRQPAAPLTDPAPDPAEAHRTPAVAPAGASDTQAARTKRARGRCQPETASA